MNWFKKNFLKSENDDFQLKIVSEASKTILDKNFKNFTFSKRTKKFNVENNERAILKFLFESDYLQFETRIELKIVN